MCQRASLPNPEPVLSAVNAFITTTLASSSRAYSSSKSTEAVNAAKSSTIPVKTKEQTEWAAKAWKEWALSRNSRILAEERPFNATFYRAQCT